jgi:hypothetical protein
MLNINGQISFGLGFFNTICFKEKLTLYYLTDSPRIKVKNNLWQMLQISDKIWW